MSIVRLLSSIIAYSVCFRFKREAIMSDFIILYYLCVQLFFVLLYYGLVLDAVNEILLRTFFNLITGTDARLSRLIDSCLCQKGFFWYALIAPGSTSHYHYFIT